MIRLLAVGFRAGLRVVRRLALLCLTAGLLIGAVGMVIRAASSGSPASDIFQFQPPAQYGYPSPSDWSLTPYPVASARVVPPPRVIVSPCPNYVPPRGWLYSPPPPSPVPTTRPDGVPACDIPGGVPPDPKTGPVMASPTSGR